MLPRRARLRRSVDITAVVRQGRRINAPGVRVYWRPGEAVTSRIACVVGTRVHKSSVVRHRYQRWLRVVAQEAGSVFPVPSDVVWVAAPAILRCESLAAVREQVAPYLKRLK